jgi:hypothetical protein
MRRNTGIITTGIITIEHGMMVAITMEPLHKLMVSEEEGGGGLTN